MTITYVLFGDNNPAYARIICALRHRKERAFAPAIGEEDTTERPAIVVVSDPKSMMVALEVIGTGRKTYIAFTEKGAQYREVIEKDVPKGTPIGTLDDLPALLDAA